MGIDFFFLLIFKSDKKSVWLLFKGLLLFGLVLHFELNFRFGFECLFDSLRRNPTIEITPRSAIHRIEIHRVVFLNVDFIH